MLAQCLRRWPNIKTAVFQHVGLLDLYYVCMFLSFLVCVYYYTLWRAAANGRVCVTPPTSTYKRKYSIASWSWVQKHVCGIKIDTSDALSGHLYQISKTFFFFLNEASYERPPVLSGHFQLALVVAAQKRFYCIQNNLLLTWLVEASLRYERPKKCPTFLPLRGHYNLWQFCFSNVMGLTLNDLFLHLHRTLLNKW